MTSRNNRSIILSVMCGSAMLLGACEEKKKPPPPPPPAPPPRVEAPKPVDIASVLQQAKSDARVTFLDTQAPADRSLAEGVIKLANALVKGDAAAMKSMLDKSAQSVLDELVNDGRWAEETKSIEQVRIVSVTGLSDRAPSSSLVGMAIQSPGGAYLLAWNGTRSGNGWTFSGSMCQGETRPRASNFDGVQIITTAFGGESFGPRADGGAGTPSAPKPAAPAKGDAPAEGPRKKSTPAGPITIPNPGGG